MVYVADIYPSREKAEDFPGMDSGMVAVAVTKAGGKHVLHAPDSRELKRLLLEEAAGSGPEGMILLFMGAGDITAMAADVADCSGKENS